MSKILKYTFIAVSLLIVLIIFLIYLTSYCTLLDCWHSVSINLPQEIVDNLESSEILVEFEDGNSIQFNLTNSQNRLIFTMGGFFPTSIELPTSREHILEMSSLKITNLDTQEEFILDVVNIDESTFRPNGWGCEPVCYIIEVDLELIQNR